MSDILLVLLAACVLSVVLIIVLRPLLQRYALARPNARSSHKIPTPQGGGIAVVLAALICTSAGLYFSGLSDALSGLPMLILGAVGLGIVGAVDDIRPLPAVVRLAFQIAAVAAVMAGAGVGPVFPFLPISVEWLFIVLAGVWFVNLVNFMDGLDWMTVAEMVPVTLALAIFSVFGWLDPTTGLVAAGLLGALLGFAPFNRPVARLFLGDVGSLPIGLIVGFLLYRLAGEGGLAAALLLPLYYLMDATLTLLRRLMRREKVWEAHRSHFYQQATDNGWSVKSVVGCVALLNIALAVLAGFCLVVKSAIWQMGFIVIGAVLVAIVLRSFSRAR